MTYKLSTVSVLLVEDMQPMRVLLKSVLDIMGFKNVHIASNGEQAFEMFCEHKPDIVITDWMMDNMSGMELITLIRQDDRSPDPFVPVILMTGYSNQSRVELARDSGMTEFLAKPFKAKDLCARIVQIIEKPRQFIKNEHFFGPDRRRRKDESPKGAPKRKEDKSK